MRQAMLRTLVPARTRASIAFLTGRNRCNAGSRCQQQARTLIERIQNALTTRSAEDEQQEDFVVVLARNNNNNNNNKPTKKTTRLSDAEVRACMWLLDPEHMLRERHTRALALATLQEALIQAQHERVASHERDAMQEIIRELELLEARLYAGPLAHCNDAPGDDEARRALLLHLGRGMELLAFDATAATAQP